MKGYFLILFALVFLLHLSILKDYGINWDEPFHYFRGQAFLHYFLTGKKDYSDLPSVQTQNKKVKNLSNRKSSFRRSIYQDTQDSYTLSFQYFVDGEGGNVGHPPTSDILASLFNYIFYQKLGIVGDIEGYHLYIIVVSTLLTCILFFFVANAYGLFAGIITFLSILLYPLFFSESHFNIKDPVEASFYSFTLISFYYATIKNSWRWVLLSALCSGIAFGTKFNIIFSMVTILMWLFILRRKTIWKREWPFTKTITISFILLPFLSFLILLALWPYLWYHPLDIIKIFLFYKDIGITSYQSNDFLLFGSINTYAIQWIIFSTPLIVLFFSLIGIIYCVKFVRKEENKTSLFVLLWFIVPVVRVSIPNAGIYGGVRQIMEYIPAMAILSGIGGYYCVKIVKGLGMRKVKLVLVEGILICLFVPITIKLISIHPNENVYFNPLIGGLRGAEQRNFPDWGNSYGNTYKQGVEWLNEHAEKNAKVSLLTGTALNVPKIYPRNDIQWDTGWSGHLRKGEYLIEHTSYNWISGYIYEAEYSDTFLNPVYEVKVDDVAILKVWKNDQSHTKPGYVHFDQNVKIKKPQTSKDRILIALDKKIYVIKLDMQFDIRKDCQKDKTGRVFLSLDGKNWVMQQDLLGRVQEIADGQQEENRIIYFLAAKPTQFIAINPTAKNSCLFNIQHVSIEKLSDIAP